jgi:phosphohistidine phosphatase
MVMIVYFLRHATAGTKRSNPTQDEKRPLDKGGIEQCGYIGRLLAALEVHPDLIISSPLKRATQTASLVGNEIGYEQKIQPDPAMRPEAKYEQFREMLRACSKVESIVVVGHNPSISAFLSLLTTNGGSNSAIDMKKGSVARVDYSNKKSVLNWLITPKIAKLAYEMRNSTSRPKTSRK